MGKWFQNKNLSTRKWKRGTNARKAHQALGILLAAALIFQTMPFDSNAVSTSEGSGGGLGRDKSCGYREAAEGSPCTYECRICPIEELIAALPDAADIRSDNADEVRAQLEEILALFAELTEDEQEQLDLSRCYELQEALDEANGSDPAEEHDWRYTNSNIANTNGINIYRTCEDCQSRENVGTIIMQDFSVPYGQTNGVELTYTTNLTGGHHLVDAEGNRVWYTYGDYPPGSGENTLHYTLGDLPVGKYMYNFAPYLSDGTEKVPFSISLNVNVTVTHAALPEIALSAESVTYNGSAQKPIVTIAGLTEGTDYDIAYSTEDFTNAGTVTITATGKGNYAGTIKKTFIIEKATPTIVWSAEKESMTYTGQPANIKPTVTLVNNESFNGTIHYKYDDYSGSALPADAGIYNIMASIAEQGNYNAVASGWLILRIDKASAPTISYPTADNITYGQKLSDSALTGGSTEYGTFAWKDGSTVPTVDNTDYTVVFTASEETKKNYETITGTTQKVSVKVEKAVTAVSITAAVSGSKGDRQSALTVNVAKAGAGAFPTGRVKLIDCTGSTEDEIGTVTLNSNGTATYTWDGLLDQMYTIKAVYEGDSNYKEAKSQEFTFDAAKQNQQDFALDAIGIKTYGDAAISLKTTGGSGSGAVRYESSDESVIRIEDGRAVIVGAGVATITAIKAGDNNYNEAFASRNVTVEKKALAVRADSKTVVRGNPMPSFTYQADGLVNGDAFMIAPSITAGAQDTDTLGKYDIVISGGTLRNSENYSITYVNGTLNIVERFYTVTVTDGTGGGSGDGGNSGGSGNNGGGNSGDNGNNGGDSGTGTPAQGIKQPFIKGEGGKTGWDVIRAEEEKAQEGSTINVDMNGSVVVPGDIFDSIKGKDITITFDMGNGILWSVDGKSIMTDRAGDIDFSVQTGVNTVPVDIVNNVTGESYSIQISLAYEGEFGFTAVLSINLGKENAGLTANLYYYNESTGELEFICKDQIAEDGAVSLAFTHASDYVIAIDGEQEEGDGAVESIQPEGNDGTAENGTATEKIPQEGQQSRLWWLIVAGVLLLVMGVGVFLMAKKKRR